MIGECVAQYTMSGPYRIPNMAIEGIPAGYRQFFYPNYRANAQQNAQAQVQSQIQWVLGRVTKVMDGDTVEFSPDHGGSVTLRLANIDAPEIGQDYGDVAKQYLENLVLDQRCAVVPTTNDQYGRTVAFLRRGNVLLNLKLVTDGMAWHYEQYSNDKTTYDRAQRQAARIRKGLWGASIGEPTPPWDFRK